MSEMLGRKLATLSARQEQLEFWCRLARSWAVAALTGLALVIFQRYSGWSSWVSLPLIILVALFLVAFTVPSKRPAPTSGRDLARQIEDHFPELDGRLLTAVQQASRDGRGLNYLQQRLLAEVLSHQERSDWAQTISDRRLTFARTAHWTSLTILVLVLFQLRTRLHSESLVARDDSSVTVTPGDVSMERGSALVVLARFSGTLPASVEMVLGSPTQAVHIPMVKSLADPMFGGTVPEVSTNFSYRVSYAGRDTRGYEVTVFDYPRLQRADADLVYPAYTGETNRHIRDTRRLSAVEGSTLDLTLELNKPVASARLVGRNKDHRVIALAVETNRPLAVLHQLTLDSTQAYDLQLLDAEGRTNKVPAQFVLEALKNRPPEIRLTTPRGDVRPSALEEIAFEGTVWDDFGVSSYGLGYSVVGQPERFVTLGQSVPGKQKQSFRYLLRLEDLQVKPDELVSWFVWADDLGPEGNVRRTVGDLFFGEIRPFDEVFREGQGMEAQGQSPGEQSGEGNQTARLTELQKQIISATWNLQRNQQRAPRPSTSERKSPGTPTPESRIRQKHSTGEENLLTAAAVTPQSPFHLESPGSGISPPRFYSSLPPLERGVSSAHRPLGVGPKIVAQVKPADPSDPGSDSSGKGAPGNRSRSKPASGGSDDLAVVRDSQAQALEQANAAAERAQDERVGALWSAALREMEKALDQLKRSTNSSTQLTEALSAEQAAYQALLRLQEHEYQVNRQRNRGQSGSARQQQMERQLDQLELTQTENRYENQRQAQAPQNSQPRDQLQVMNRLQELARRQNDLNERLKELQSALSEARTEEERAELQRRLKRLQEEEQQMLADVDELRQRMDRPENQSRMADERRQLDQTREDIQRAAESARQGSASQALASGTRAERQLQEMRDQLRKENSSQFAEDLRSMRAQARELAQKQQEIQKALQEGATQGHKSLSDTNDSRGLLSQLDQQKEVVTNLVERATQISQQAETSEPLLSTELYDTVRKFSQESAKSAQEMQDELLGRGLMPSNLMDLLKSDSEPDGAKLLDVTSEMVRRDFLPQASQASQRAGERLENLKRGVERAAESVLGDDTEALRMAQQELDQLTAQLQGELAQAQAQAGQDPTNQPARQNGAATANSQSRDAPAAARGSEHDQQADPGSRESTPSTASPQSDQAATSTQPSPSSAGGQSGGARNGGSPANGSGRDSENPARESSRQARLGGDSRNPADRAGRARADGGDASDSSSGGGVGGGGLNFDRFLNDQAWRRSGPITGEDFLPWSDRLREVEEMIEIPDLKNEVAAARERARRLRQDYKQSRKKPDWAVVRAEVMSPLIQVRQRLADELAHRQSGEALVPIDRDPVPNRYSDLVRRYYEELGKEK